MGLLTEEAKSAKASLTFLIPKQLQTSLATHSGFSDVPTKRSSLPSK